MSANHRTRLFMSNRIKCHVQIDTCICNSICGRNKNGGKRCSLYHRQASCEAVSETGHVLEQRFSKKYWRRSEGQGKLTFEAFKMSYDNESPDPDSQETDTKQVWQRLRAFLGISSYAVKDPFLRNFIYSFFRAGQSSVALINGGQFLQTLLNTARRGSVSILGIKISSVFKFHMFFYNMAMVKNVIQAKNLTCSR